MGSSVARPTADRICMISLVPTLRFALRTLCIVVLIVTVHAAAARADQFADGHAAYLRGDIDTALSLWIPLAEQGDAEAQYMLGLIYFNGRYVEKDGDVAAKWLALSAAQGNSDAELLLGVLQPPVSSQVDMSQGARK